MQNKIKGLLIAAFFVSVVCCLSVFRFERITSNVVQAQTEPSRLSLEVSIPQENYLKAEPISLKLKLFNSTNQPILWKGYLGGRTTDLVVINAEGVQFRFDGKEFMTHVDYIRLAKMQPGEHVEESILLDRHLAEKLLSSAGQYQLRVEFTYNRNTPGQAETKILSNSIPITILEPEGINKQAYQFLKDKIDPASDYQMGKQASIALRQQFVDRYRNSVYAKYIIFTLGNSYEISGDDVKALRELCKVSGENFHHTKDVEKIVLRIGERLNPVVYVQGALPPILRHPCTGAVMN